MSLIQDFASKNSDITRSIPLDNFIYSVHISLKHKYIYVETPKVCCSTLKTRLISAELEQDIRYKEFEQIHNREFSPLLNPKQVFDFPKLTQSKDYFKFCFVRSPFSKLLSCYLDKICKQHDPRRKKICLQLGRSTESKEQVSYEDFISCICDQPVSLMDPHWRTQYYQTLQNTIKYDYIGKFESFEQDYKNITELIGLKATEAKHNELRHATSACNQLNKYYNKNTIEMIVKKFQIDFEYFNYNQNKEQSIIFDNDHIESQYVQSNPAKTFEVPPKT